MSVGPGTRLRSQVCDTEVIVIGAPSTDVVLSCGGAELIGVDAAPSGEAPAEGLDTGNQLGKRYTSPGVEGLELLVTKAGAGTLAADGEPLVLKESAALPASD